MASVWVMMVGVCEFSKGSVRLKSRLVYETLMCAKYIFECTGKMISALLKKNS